MGTKTLIRLVIALAVVGGIATILNYTNSGGVSEVTSSTTKKKIFDQFPLNDVAKVEIVGRGTSLTLSKGEALWEVNERDGYPADAEPIIKLLRDIWALEVVQPITIGRSQFGRLSLIKPSEADDEEEAATILTFSNAEGDSLASLWLGKVYERSDNRPNPMGGGMAMTDAGRYVKTGDSNAVYLVGQTFNEATTEAPDWINKNFFKVTRIKSIELLTGDKANDWKLARNEPEGDLTLLGAKEGEELDQAKVTSMKGAFANPAMEDVLTKAEAGSGENEVEEATFKINTFDGFSYVIKTGEKNDLNQLPISLKVSAKFEQEREAGEDETEEDKDRLDKEFQDNLNGLKTKLANEKKLEGNTYIVRSYLVDNISKPRAELMVSEDPAPQPAPGGGQGLPPGLNLQGIPGLGN
jgi:hypothetical protein